MKSSYRGSGGLRRDLAGAATARAGDEMSGPALLLLGFAATGRPATGSGLLASVTIAGAVGGPVFGALLDRSRRPDRVLAGTLAAYALGIVAVQAAVGRLPMAAVVPIALAAGLFNPSIGMLLVCCPVLGAQRLGGLARGALLNSAIAVVSLIATAILARRPGRGQPDVWVLASTRVIGVSMAAAAAAPGWLTLAAVALAGAGEGPQLTALFAVRHRETPEHMRGQVYITAASLKIAGMAAGAALAGPLAGHSATGCMLVAAGTELCAGAAYLLAGPGRPNRGWRVPVTTPPGTACTGHAARTTARSEQGC